MYNLRIFFYFNPLVSFFLSYSFASFTVNCTSHITILFNIFLYRIIYFYFSIIKFNRYLYSSYLFFYYFHLLYCFISSEFLFHLLCASFYISQKIIDSLSHLFFMPFSFLFYLFSSFYSSLVLIYFSMMSLFYSIFLSLFITHRFTLLDYYNH